MNTYWRHATAREAKAECKRRRREGWPSGRRDPDSRWRDEWDKICNWQGLLDEQNLGKTIINWAAEDIHQQRMQPVTGLRSQRFGPGKLVFSADSPGGEISSPVELQGTLEVEFEPGSVDRFFEGLQRQEKANDD